ncbi:IS1 family transposase, partial [Escherichia coli]
FSRSVELHEKVIGAFIEKYMFYSLKSSSKNLINRIIPITF